MITLFTSGAFAKGNSGLNGFADFQINTKNIEILFEDNILNDRENINNNIYIVDEENNKISMEEFYISSFDNFVIVDLANVKLEPNKIYKLYVDKDLSKEDETKLGVELICPFKLSDNYSNIIELKNKDIEKAIREECELFEGDLTQGHLEECESVNISKLTDFKNLDEINLLKNLYTLNFENCDLSELEDFKLELDECNELKFNQSYIKNFNGFYKNPILEQIEFKNANVESFDGIDNFKNINMLDFWDMNLNEIDFEKIFSTWDIKNLSICNCESDDLNFLNDSKNITDLELSMRNEIDLDDLKNLKLLIDLDLSHSTLKNVVALEDMKELKSLSLYDCEIDDDELNYLGNINSIDELELVNCNISSIDFLTDLENLEWLEIGHNNLNDISAISNLKNLRFLCLKNNEIENIDALKGLDKLEQLSITDNNISNIDVLKELKSLEEIILSDIQVDKFKDVLDELDGVKLDIINRY
jgi:Leucine-rich repeat (LRR) protein